MIRFFLIIIIAMLLTHLSLLNYRNIADASLSLSPNLNCLIGFNGEGKTNLLDAIYYLSFCRSAFTTIDANVLRHDEPFFSLEGHYTDNSCGEMVIHCGMKRGVRKVFRRDKKAYRKLSEHIGLIPVVMIAPSDIAIIEGGSEVRRHMMDTTIAQYNHAYLHSLTRYQQALTQRNALLKAEEEPDDMLMDVLEEQMADEGMRIYERRKQFVEEILPYFNRLHNIITHKTDNVSIVYASHCQRDELLKLIRSGREKDRIVGYSRYGIHRDDLQVELNGWAMRTEGSQGQHKSMTIALKLAIYLLLQQKNNNIRPILLLDDIFDKLDAQRVENIVSLVAGEDFGQIFITDTNRTHIDKILEKVGSDYQLFNVEHGTITPIS